VFQGTDIWCNNSYINVDGRRIYLYVLLQGMSLYVSFFPVFVNVKQVWSHHHQWNFRLNRHFTFHVIFTGIPVYCKSVSSSGPGFVSRQGQKCFSCIPRPDKFWGAASFLSNGSLGCGVGLKHCGGNDTLFPLTSIPSLPRLSKSWINEELGSIPGKGKYFLTLHSLQTSSGTHPYSYLMRTGDVSPGVKRPERQADHTPRSNVDFKNA
jgi:hypothetical protein